MRTRSPWQAPSLTLITALCGAYAATSAPVDRDHRLDTLSPELEQLSRHEGAGPLPVVIILRDYPDLEGWSSRSHGPRSSALATQLRQHHDRSSGRLAMVLEDLADKGHAQDIRSFWIFNGFTAELSAAAVRQVADHPAVALVRLDQPIAYPEPVTTPPRGGDERNEWNIDQVNAPDAWSRGYRGQGVVVGSFDTGVNGSHPDLSSQYLGGPGAWYDPYGEHPDSPYDAGGHGTHTTGTILGGQTGGSAIGVAPDARWIGAKAWMDNGFSSIVQFAQIFEWFLDPDGDPRTDDAPAAVSNSWGVIYDGCLLDLRRNIAAWRAAGIFPSFASGNSGPGAGSSESPGNYPETFSVGATDSRDRIASFSGRGPSDCDQSRIKPDISAPGVSVRSCVGSSWQSWSGTSMATPHITGAVAILKSADPTLSIEEIEEALKAGAEDRGATGPDNDYGWGRLDVDASVQTVLDLGTISGQITRSKDGAPIDAMIAIEESGRSAATDSDGYYSLRMPGDVTYTVTITSFGYADAQASVPLRARADIERDFALDALPSGPITGVVTGPDDQPLPGALVELSPHGPPPILSDGDGSFSFDAVPVGYSLELVTTRCDLTDDRQAVVVTGPAGIEVAPQLLSPAPDDVESGANGWRHEVVTNFYTDDWHLSQHRSRSGTTAWKCGGAGDGHYGDYVDAGLITRCYGVDRGTTLSFWQWMKSEPNPTFRPSVWDGGILEASEDNGSTWSQIFPAGGYPNHIVSNPANPLAPGTPCYGGIEDEWKHSHFDLHDLAGELRFRFRFASDGLVTNEGWYIDDITLTPTAPDLTLDLVDAPSSVEPGSAANFTIDIVNREERAFKVDFWIDAVGNGAVHSHEIASDEEIAAEQSASPRFRIAVPRKIKSGDYTLYTRLGVYPDVVYAEDSTVITVR